MKHLPQVLVLTHFAHQQTEAQGIAVIAPGPTVRMHQQQGQKELPAFGVPDLYLTLESNVLGQIPASYWLCKLLNLSAPQFSPL